jgi:hypothetical protein
VRQQCLELRRLAREQQQRHGNANQECQRQNGGEREQDFRIAQERCDHDAQYQSKWVQIQPRSRIISVLQSTAAELKALSMRRPSVFVFAA